MKYLGYAFRFLTNFVFLAMAYFSLNFTEKYEQRALVAMLILAFAAMRAVSTLRSFYFFQRIERLEHETRRLASHIAGGPGEAVARKMIVNEVGELRRGRGSMCGRRSADRCDGGCDARNCSRQYDRRQY